MTIVQMAIVFVRLGLMITAEILRIYKYSMIKIMRSHARIMILLGRQLFNIISLLPFLIISYYYDKFRGIPFILSVIVLTIEELPSLFAVFFIYFVK